MAEQKTDQTLNRIILFGLNPLVHINLFRGCRRVAIWWHAC